MVSLNIRIFQSQTSNTDVSLTPTNKIDGFLIYVINGRPQSTANRCIGIGILDRHVLRSEMIAWLMDEWVEGCEAVPDGR